MLKIRKRVLSRLYRLGFSAKDKELYHRLVKDEIKKEAKKITKGTLEHRIEQKKKALKKESKHEFTDVFKAYLEPERQDSRIFNPRELYPEDFEEHRKPRIHRDRILQKRARVSVFTEEKVCQRCGRYECTCNQLKNGGLKIWN